MPQYLFGIRIAHDVSMGFVLLELFDIPVAGIALVVSSTWLPFRRLCGPAATPMPR